MDIMPSKSSLTLVSTHTHRRRHHLSRLHQNETNFFSFLYLHILDFFFLLLLIVDFAAVFIYKKNLFLLYLLLLLLVVLIAYFFFIFFIMISAKIVKMNVWIYLVLLFLFNINDV